MTQGRIAWNVVTSYLPNAARNFGLPEMIKHDRRYDIADEYLEVCYKLWELSWEDGAVIEDVKNGILVDPSKVHEINHSGEFFHVEGPHLSEPSLQRTLFYIRLGYLNEEENLLQSMRNVYLLGANSGKDQVLYRGY